MTAGERRAAAAQACIDRFKGKAYEPGRRDDVRMAAHLLHHLGVAVPLLKGVEWSSEKEGLRVLSKMGFASVHEAADTLGLPRIGWASARTGDLIALESLCGVGAFGVHTGNGAMLCFREGRSGAAIVRLTDALHAWRTV